MTNTPITLNLKNSTVKYLIEMTKEIGQLLSNNFVTLQKGKHYYLPINEKDETLTNPFSIFKVSNELSDYIDVKFIDKGIATIIPLVHNFQLTDGITIGQIINLNNK